MRSGRVRRPPWLQAPLSGRWQMRAHAAPARMQGYLGGVGMGP